MMYLRWAADVASHESSPHVPCGREGRQRQDPERESPAAGVAWEVDCEWRLPPGDTSYKGKMLEFALVDMHAAAHGKPCPLQAALKPECDAGLIRELAADAQTLAKARKAAGGRVAIHAIALWCSRPTLDADPLAETGDLDSIILADTGSRWLRAVRVPGDNVAGLFPLQQAPARAWRRPVPVDWSRQPRDCVEWRQLFLTKDGLDDLWPEKWTSWAAFESNLDNAFGTDYVRAPDDLPASLMSDPRAAHLAGWASFHRTGVYIHSKNEWWYVTPRVDELAHSKARLGRAIVVQLGDDQARHWFATSAEAAGSANPHRHVCIAPGLVHAFTRLAFTAGEPGERGCISGPLAIETFGDDGWEIIDADAIDAKAVDAASVDGVLPSLFSRKMTMLT